MRPGVDPSSTAAHGTGGKFFAADASVGGDSSRGIDRSAARMIESLKQAGMIVVLVLLSEGLFVLSGASTPGQRKPSSAKSTITLEFVAGAILCSSALMLLYSLGTRDEK
jgi:hypothetical protein